MKLSKETLENINVNRFKKPIAYNIVGYRNGHAVTIFNKEYVDHATACKMCDLLNNNPFNRHEWRVYPEELTMKIKLYKDEQDTKINNAPIGSSITLH